VGAWSKKSAKDATCNGGMCLSCQLLPDAADTSPISMGAALLRASKEGAGIMHSQTTYADNFATAFYGPKEKDKEGKVDESVASSSAMDALAAGAELVVKGREASMYDTTLSREAKFQLVLRAAHGKLAFKYSAVNAHAEDGELDEPEPEAPPPPPAAAESRKRTRTKYDQVGALLYDQQASWTASRAQLGREALSGAGWGHALLVADKGKRQRHFRVQNH
jgi:hypothetical protein